MTACRSWSFLFGKPMLERFAAIHDYGVDIIKIQGEGGKVAEVRNMLEAYRTWDRNRGDVHAVFLDPKTCATPTGGHRAPPVRRVHPDARKGDVEDVDQRDTQETQAPEEPQKPSDIRKQEARENSKGDLPSPSREVQSEDDGENEEDTDELYFTAPEEPTNEEPTKEEPTKVEERTVHTEVERNKTRVDLPGDFARSPQREVPNASNPDEPEKPTDRVLWTEPGKSRVQRVAQILGMMIMGTLLAMAAQYGGVKPVANTQGTPSGDQRSPLREVPSPEEVFEDIVTADTNTSETIEVPQYFLKYYARQYYVQKENKRRMQQRRKMQRARAPVVKEEAEENEEEEMQGGGWGEVPSWMKADVRIHGKVVRPRKRRADVTGGGEPPAREVPDSLNAQINDGADTKMPGQYLTEEQEELEALREATPQEVAAYLVNVAAGAKAGVPVKDPDGEPGTEQPEFEVGGDISVFTQSTDPRNPRRVEALLDTVTIGPDLTVEQRQEVREFVTEFADCFALSMKEVLPIPGAEHTMNIPKDAKFSTKVHQRPTTPVQKAWYNGVIDEMLEAGIIEPLSPKDAKCLSPTTLAQKTHQNGKTQTILELQHQINDQCIAAGLPPSFDLPPRPPETMQTEMTQKPPSWRVCHDYHELNSKTKVAALPPGDIQRKQGLLSGHRWVSVFDFAKGFYACTTAEEIRPYLCFYVEGRGLFTYCKMPMGLTGVPSTFGKTTGGALGDMVGTKIQLFVDDGGMAGDVFEDKMADLRVVFERIREHRLSLSAQKMQFFMTEATFAGNRVGPDGIKPDLTKLTAIVDWKTPHDLLNLKSFLGLCGHFRALIKNYARIAQPLTDLERLAKVGGAGSKGEWRKRMRVVELLKAWTEKHQAAFVALKTMLTSEPVLKGPVFDGRPFIVTTDGLKEGFGGMLCQRFETTMPDGKVVSRLHPIAFVSKHTSLAEERYKPYLLEFAALK
jgi:hypothetical protein